MAFTSFAAGGNNPNQFAQSALPGSLDLQSNPNPEVVTCRLNPSSTYTTGIPGAVPLKLVDLGGSDTDGVPIVDVADALTDQSFGVSVLSTKVGLTLPGDTVQVAANGAIVRMVSTAAINRGLQVITNATVGGKVQTIVGKTGKVLGLTLDKATAADQVIRIKILCDGTTLRSVSS
jgi:hypothetical protein